MSKTAYVMAAGGDWPGVRGIQAVLRARGYVIDNDWTVHQDSVAKRDVEHSGGLDHAIKLAAARRNMASATTSDLCVLYCGEHFPKILGGLLETGAAMTHGVETHIISPPRDSVFWAWPTAQIFAGVSVWVEALDMQAASIA